MPVFEDRKIMKISLDEALKLACHILPLQKQPLEVFYKKRYKI